MSELFDLQGRTALVTGGAGQYGSQIVRALVEAGAQTYVASRNLERLSAFASSFGERSHLVVPLQLDQGEEDSIKAARDVVAARSGGLDILVNNAVSRPVTRGMDDEPAAFDASFRVNATGVILVTRTFGALLRDGGSIINIGSMMGLVGLEPANYRGTDMGGWPVDYFYNKGGMVNLTRFLASYFGPRNIRCNCVHPGGLMSPGLPEQFVQNYSERTCLGRLGSDTDLMGIVVFLASDASAYVTGTNIPVDGGYTAK